MSGPPGTGPMAPGRAVLLALLLSSLQACGARPPEHGLQWVWGTAEQAPAEPPLSPRRRRADVEPNGTTMAPGYGHAATAMPIGNETESPGHGSLLGTELPSEPGNTTSNAQAVVETTMGPMDETNSAKPLELLGTEPPLEMVDGTSHARVMAVTAAHPMDETDSPEPLSLLGTEPPPEMVNSTSHAQAVVVTTTDPMDETDSPEPVTLLGTESPPEMVNSTSHAQAMVVTTTDPMDETDSPEPLKLLGTESPLEMANSTLQAQAVVGTTTDPMDETDPPKPDLLLSTAPAPQNGGSTVPSWLVVSKGPGMEGTATTTTDNSTEPDSALPPTTFYKKSGVRPSLNPSLEGDMTPPATKPWGTTALDPDDDLWDNSWLMNKCLLAILLLALLAGLFMVCTGVLGTLLWRKARTARQQFGPTEMVCISSLLPDREHAATNGPRLGVPRRHKLLPDVSSEADGDNLTLSSFLPEHS